MWGAEWTTDGGNPQRTGWQRDEKILTKENVKNLKALWKLSLGNEPRELHSLLPPLIVGQVNASRGPKQIAIVAGVSDNSYAIDVDAGSVLWKEISYTAEVPQRTVVPPPRRADRDAEINRRMHRRRPVYVVRDGMLHR
jgi:glucose dehydrogenase